MKKDPNSKLMELPSLNTDVGSGIYLVDLLDIAIIAIFAYIAILFLKQTRSFAAFVGLGMLAIIYVLARSFQLYITTLLLQAFFSIFIIVLVVVFQDELKRSFELLATSGTRSVKKRKPLAYSSTIFAVVQAVSGLMRKKHGALIIIPGKEFIERHLRGGNILDGIATSSLLESIFDPKSPGHDGAVIISRDRVTKFGVHLPLSQNLKQIKDKGTRHSAAIGVSEKTDAFAIVVSEERGEVSVAKNGKLKTLEDTRELEKYLIQHYKETFPQKRTSFLGSIFKERLVEKISAVLIASLAWFIVVYQAEIVQRDFSVPISYTGVSMEKVIESTEPEFVTVTLSARGQAVLGNISSDAIRITIPGDKIESGTTELPIEEKYVSHPFNVSVINISPSYITITAQEYTTHEIDIEPNIVGEPEKVKITETSVSPSKIKFLVPKDEEPVSHMKTEEIHVGDVKEDTTLETRVSLPSAYRLHNNASASVNVTLKVEEKE